MATPRKSTDTGRKVEPLVIIPDSVADFDPPAPASSEPPVYTETPVYAETHEISPEPIVAAPAVIEAVETAAKTVAKAEMSTVAKNIHNTQTEIKTNMDKAMKTAEELVTFGQGNIEAIMKSNQIWMAGLQDMSKAFAATAQAQMEETVSTMKSFAGLRSIKDAMDLQTSFARTSFEKALSESGKLTEHSMKLAEQAMAPITARMTIAVEKFGRAV
jgi:phasin family protein